MRSLICSRIAVFVVLLTIGLSLAACATPVAQQEEVPPRYPAANLAEDFYAPGPEWTLVWSDEFDGETLDPRKWRRQVEEAGRSSSC